MEILDTTEATGSANGSMLVRGGATISKSLVVNNNVATGALTVTGGTVLSNVTSTAFTASNVNVTSRITGANLSMATITTGNLNVTGMLTGGNMNIVSVTASNLNVPGTLVVTNITYSNLLQTGSVIATASSNTIGSIITSGGNYALIGNGAAWAALGLWDVPGAAWQINSGGYNLNIGNGTVGSANSVTTRLVLNSTGNVGIGVTSPVEKVHIDGSILLNSGGSLWITGNNDNQPNRLRIHHDGTTGFVDYGSNGLYFRGGTIGVGAGMYHSLSFNTNGNVGIGTDTPTELLDVNGGARLCSSNVRLTTFAGINYIQSDMPLDIGPIMTTAHAVRIRSASNTSTYNGASNASIFVSKDGTTGRSINAAGSINASGADYAEYMHKSGDFIINKGDIAGVNAQGKLTNIFDDAVTFLVKSTDPGAVGGDSWGQLIPPEPQHPGQDASQETLNNYNTSLQQWQALVEEKRSEFDRMSYAGQVPVNVYNAQPGDYIIPNRKEDGTIEGIAVNDQNITFDQYTNAVGKVIKISDDGRAYIIVKVL
jgi:hypothetical protein